MRLIRAVLSGIWDAIRAATEFEKAVCRFEAVMPPNGYCRKASGECPYFKPFMKLIRRMS